MDISYAGSGASQTPTARTMVRDLKPKAKVNWAFGVRDVDPRRKKDGKEFLKLLVGDRTGALDAMLWKLLDEDVVIGSVLILRGRFEVHPKWGSQLKVDEGGARFAEKGEFDPRDLFPMAPLEVVAMAQELDWYIGRVQDALLREVLLRLIGPEGAWRKAYLEEPAAMRMHEGFRHGLVYHSLRVVRTALASVEGCLVAGIDPTELQAIRDLVIAGALLHDVAKVKAYDMSADGFEIKMTDAEKLRGHIQNGVYGVRRMIERVAGVAIDAEPSLMGNRLVHIIESHHGSLAHGSSVVPMTREARFVHHADACCADQGMFDRLESELRPGEAWSAFDRGLETSVWFPHLAGAPEAPPV